MKTVKRRSQLQEKSVAKDMGARTVVASGAMWSSKGDVRNDKYLIECKTTEKDYYSITTKVWEKIALEADKDGMRIPLLFVDLKDSERYVICNPHDFEKQVNTYEVVPHVHGGCKSYRFKGYSDEGLPLLFSLTPIKMNKKNHILMAFNFSDFKKLEEQSIES